jgi:catechol 2,3-dioxygenase-like lactoylglutathione lyase family enzyme
MIGIRHIGLIVDDLDKSLELYNDVLGFTPKIDQVEKGTFYEHITGIKFGVARTCKCYSSNGTCIELIQYQSESLIKREKTLVCEGFNHIALDVDEIDKLYKKLKSIGITFINPPKYNDDKTAIVAFCKDFEGNYLELVQTNF